MYCSRILIIKNGDWSVDDALDLSAAPGGYAIRSRSTNTLEKEGRP